MDPDRIRHLDAAEAAGYLPHLRAIAKSAAVPVWWWRNSLPAGNSILHNGTLCAVKAGTRTLCVTADHVYAKYLQHTSEYSDVECQMGCVRVRLEEYLVDRNESVDIAIFEISPILVAASGVVAHSAPTWPPEKLTEGEIVILGGYPALLRDERTKSVDIPFATFIAPVAQSSGSHSAFQLNLRDSYWPDGSGGIPPGSELGGMSGGPIFKFNETHLEYLTLAGFIYEAHSEFELIRGRHASCIDKVGKIAEDS